ncbi:MAG TPA: uridine kinase [Verrucomicrobiae bacterium]|nr:uridine kinase [Verrucomicrobiae bacterium]
MLKHHNILVAITGGSGSGKTFLADRLQMAFSTVATRLSLDNFYLDRSNLPPSRRAKINFDHPRAIDWPVAEKILRDCRRAAPIQIPKYDFESHVRRSEFDSWIPTPLVLWDGLWLLSRPAMRSLFDLKIFLECPTQLRLERRLARDISERGRTAGSVREQFWRTVFPMHVRYVAPQAAWADIILQQPSSESEMAELIEIIRGLLAKAASSHGLAMEPSTSTVPPAAQGRPSCGRLPTHARSVVPANKSLNSI